MTWNLSVPGLTAQLEPEAIFLLTIASSESDAESPSIPIQFEFRCLYTSSLSNTSSSSTFGNDWETSISNVVPSPLDRRWVSMPSFSDTECAVGCVCVRVWRYYALCLKAGLIPSPINI